MREHSLSSRGKRACSHCELQVGVKELIEGTVSVWPEEARDQLVQRPLSYSHAFSITLSLFLTLFLSPLSFLLWLNWLKWSKRWSEAAVFSGYQTDKYLVSAVPVGSDKRCVWRTWLSKNVDWKRWLWREQKDGKERDRCAVFWSAMETFIRHVFISLSGSKCPQSQKTILRLPVSLFWK